jgi:hypothetical protein
MRTLGLALAVVVGIFCWMPLYVIVTGRFFIGNGLGVDGAVVFWTPILLLAVPLGLIANSRGASVGVAWISALAPLLGYFNFALLMVYGIGKVHSPLSTGSIIRAAHPILWLTLLGIVLGMRALDRRAHKRAQQQADTPTDSRPVFRMYDDDE